MVCQTTLLTSTPLIRGPRIDRDEVATVRLHPAPAGTGIEFVRTDLPGEPRVTCHVDHVSTQSRWSALEQHGVIVQFTEHLLAAVAGCGIDNIRVELDGDCIPVVTAGSCAGFVAAIQAVGTKVQPQPRSVLRLARPVYHEMPLDIPAGSGSVHASYKRYILGLPNPHFTAAYFFHVPTVPGMRPGLAEFDSADGAFADQLATARTYYLTSEARVVRELLSSARTDYIVLGADSSQSDVDEVACHKLIDFWGDLALLGKPLWGRFAAFRTGHRFHHEFIRTLARDGYLETVELADCKEYA